MPISRGSVPVLFAASWVLAVACSSGPSGNPSDSSSGGSSSGSGGDAAGVGGDVAGAGGTTGSGGDAALGSGGDGVGSGGAATGGTGGMANGSGGSGPEVDPFGIEQLHPSAPGGDLWNSLHWGAGDARTIDGRDPSDPTGFSIRRGDTNLMSVDGEGVMSMGGNQPRFYIQPETGEEAPFFRDVEFTGYYLRTADDGASNSGFSVGIRAHLNGHGTVDHCLASTYYLIFRNSGTWIFDKELDHPNDAPRTGGYLFESESAIPVGGLG